MAIWNFGWVFWVVWAGVCGDNFGFVVQCARVDCVNDSGAECIGVSVALCAIYVRCKCGVPTMGFLELCLGIGVLAMVLVGFPWPGTGSVAVPVVYQQVVLARQVAKTYGQRTIVDTHDTRIQRRYRSGAAMHTLDLAVAVEQNRPVGFTHSGRTSRSGTIFVADQGRVTVGVGFGQIRMRP